MLRKKDKISYEFGAAFPSEIYWLLNKHLFNSSIIVYIHSKPNTEINGLILLAQKRRSTRPDAYLVRSVYFTRLRQYTWWFPHQLGSLRYPWKIQEVIMRILHVRNSCCNQFSVNARLLTWFRNISLLPRRKICFHNIYVSRAAKLGNIRGCNNVS